MATDAEINEVREFFRNAPPQKRMEVLMRLESLVETVTAPKDATSADGETTQAPQGEIEKPE